MGGKKSDVRVVHGVRLQHLQRPSDERDGVLDAIRRVQQRDLLVSDIKVGDVQVAQGDLAGALKSYRDGLAIADRPAKPDPGNAVRQRDLSAWRRALFLSLVISMVMMVIGQTLMTEKSRKAPAAWTVADAKARLSQLIERAQAEPQTITRNGSRASSFVSVEEWARKAARKGARADFLLSSPLRGADLDLERESPSRATSLFESP
jgi:prevent-host-death family protein